jgi:DNA polymerase IV (DinB-like DNA polymerase)
MERLRKYADKFEQVSIDEAFLDVTQSSTGFGGAVELAKGIKSELKEAEGLTCSIGIAPNVSAAKIASDFQKPDGLTYIDCDGVKEFLAPLEVSKISGIGKRTERSLNELGIKTIGDLAAYPPKELYKQFGKPAIWLWAIANGDERVEVQENYVMKSIGAEHTFEEDEDDWHVIDRELASLIESVHGRLEDEKKLYRTITLKIRFKGFETFTRAKTLAFSTSSEDVILETISGLAKEFRGYPKKVRLVGVRLSGFEERPSTAGQTLDSFASP